MMDSLSNFLLMPVLHKWCNKGHGVCYHVRRMVPIKEPLLLIEKNNHVVEATGFISI